MRSIYSSVVAAALFLLPVLTNGQGKINSFKMDEVRLQPGIFKDAENMDLKYIMALNPDRLLAPFFREAGLAPKGKSYPNWENTGLDGHIGGHYLSALSLMYAANGNQEVLTRLNYMLQALRQCQQKNGDGYIGGVPGSKSLWQDIANGKINAGTFDLNRKWVPLYNIHKTYSGLRDAYVIAHSELAKQMLIDFTDWMLQVTSKLNDQQVQTLLKSEHGGLNEVFADVYAITGDKKYLELAKRFSHQQILEPLTKQQDKLNNLHANTQIPKVIGFERIASLEGNSGYHTAATFFWDNVVNHRSVAIGGNSVREHFHPASNFSSMIESEQGPETCNTYNMLKLTKMLFESDGATKFIDYYERAMYNHILSTQHPIKGGFVYFTPMRPGHYRVYSQPETSFWCCVGSGMENHAKYNELIYAHRNNEVFVNLFIPSTLTWKKMGLVLQQQTRFPEEERTTLIVSSVKQSDFVLKVRHPSWVAAGNLMISVNNEQPRSYPVVEGYVTVKKKWRKGDQISIALPMHTTAEQLPDGSNYVALLYGPIVLAAKTDTLAMTAVFADDGRMAHVANGPKYPLQNMPLLVSNNDNIADEIKPVAGKKLTFSASNLIYPTSAKGLELIPFYQLYDARYQLYWQKLTPAKLEEVRAKTAKYELAKAQLDSVTIDQVTPGEQQPESDHFIETENATTGVTDDRHWRAARGWFSYVLKDKEGTAKKVRLTYHRNDSGRRFKILLNGQLVQEVQLQPKDESLFFSEDYAVPNDVLKKKSNGQFIIRFEAIADAPTPAIYEVRLLKK